MSHNLYRIIVHRAKQQANTVRAGLSDSAANAYNFDQIVKEGLASLESLSSTMHQVQKEEALRLIARAHRPLSEYLAKFSRHPGVVFQSKARASYQEDSGFSSTAH